MYSGDLDPGVVRHSGGPGFVWPGAVTSLSQEWCGEVMALVLEIGEQGNVGFTPQRSGSNSEAQTLQNWSASMEEVHCTLQPECEEL